MQWIQIATVLTLLAQAAALGLVAAGMLRGPLRNVAVQVMVGGLMVLVLLGATALRYTSPRFPRRASRLALLGLIAIALLLSGLYILRVAPILSSPVDLGSWSEPMFVLDIIKLRTGTTLYLAPGDSNSNTYTFGTPALSYALAALFGQSDSIVFYRFLLQGYVALAAVVGGWAAWRLLRLADPGRAHTGLWLIFFVLTSYVLATNGTTNIFNIYLHNDPLAVLAASVGWALMVEHAVTRHPGWLWAMAAMPALGFLAKQYLAILALVYIVYVWLDGSYPMRRVLWFAAACLGTLAAVLGMCLAVWGDAYRYWVFEVMGTHVVSFEQLFTGFAAAAVFLLPGFAAGGLLLGRGSAGPLLGMWMGWLVMVLGAVYTTGVTYHPSHLGPATVVGGCLFLPLLARLWPQQAEGAQAQECWLRLTFCSLIVVALFAAWGGALPMRHTVSPDLERYVVQIEGEFYGQDPHNVLLDTGEWIYLRHGVVATDRSPIFTTHRRRHDDLARRVREKRFTRILVHNLAPGLYSYELGGIHSGIRKEILQNYEEVRRIAAVRGMDSWRYRNLMLSEISVLEPIPPTEATLEPAAAPGNRREP